MEKIEYKFYSDIFGGKLSPEDFSLYEFKARKFIDKITFNRINSENITDDIKFCVCIILEKIKKADEERSFKISEGVGKHNISYSETLIQEFEKTLYKEAIKYLPSELLYRGING